MHKIIGIDPGLAETGIGIIKCQGLKIYNFSYGCIRTSPKKVLAQRLDHIFSDIMEILEEEKPDLMVVEDVFSMGKFPQAGITLGKVIGVILLAGCRQGISIKETQVREVKQALTGSGSSGKNQLEQSVRHFLGIKTRIKPLHASDALALALTELFQRTTK